MKTTITITNLKETAFGVQVNPGSPSHWGYDASLKAPLASLAEEGDTLLVWDRGGDYLPSIRMSGELIKSGTGIRYQLKGWRDVGIHSGHAPRMDLLMEQTMGIIWKRDDSQPTRQIYRAPWGTWYATPGVFSMRTFPRDHASHQSLVEADPSLEVISLPPNEEGDFFVPLQGGRRLSAWDVHSMDGWVYGKLSLQKKTIGSVDTDLPVIIPSSHPSGWSFKEEE